MYKNILILLFIFGSNFIYSQIKISEQIDVSSFPEIEFVLNNRNPKVLEKSSFIFYEFVKDKKLPSELFKVSSLEDSINYNNQNKCVLILYETLLDDDRREQLITFNYALQEVLKDVVKPGDKIKIMSFALTYKDGTVLKNVNTNFTDDVNSLQSSLDNLDIPPSPYTNNIVSNIYDAIIEGVELLDDFDSNLPKSILLLSEESHNKKIVNESVNAISLAKEKGIVINTIKYNKHANYQHRVPSLALQTYGVSKILGEDLLHRSTVNQNKKEEAKLVIKNILNNVVGRSKGVDYKVVLTLNNKIKDGKEYNLQVKIDDTDSVFNLTYRSPGNWLYAQFQLNFIPACIVSGLLLIILVLFVSFFIKKYKTKKAKEVERIQKQKEIEDQQSAEIASQKEEIINMKKSAEDHLLRERDKKEKAQEELLKQEMLSNSNGSFPFLKFVDNNNKSLKFLINKPVVNVGRDKNSNEIVINDNNISRNHFSIIYEKNKYKIIDNNSTNGIVLNGKKISSGFLDNSAIIQIADLKFIFFK